MNLKIFSGLKRREWNTIINNKRGEKKKKKELRPQSGGVFKKLPPSSPKSGK
jgi:hypothetical protein